MIYFKFLPSSIASTFIPSCLVLPLAAVKPEELGLEELITVVVHIMELVACTHIVVTKVVLIQHKAHSYNHTMNSTFILNYSRLQYHTEKYMVSKNYCYLWT